ncbi:carboxylesterase family [Fusarium beomiforme]|uniref:Carboxylesterase family n=1 Tax=Fusarium beomiforme TaxID=44412 RepID=A0A9P5E1V7_9HYPO|nr:carboxylesterase family [Fusarium beomiforme]
MDGLILISSPVVSQACPGIHRQRPDVEKDGDLNAGLLDERLALKWVEDNNHLFGGSRDKMLNQGKKGSKAPFAQVITQSPAFIPTFQAPKSAYSESLEALNVTSLAEARQASSEAVIAANARQIGAALVTIYIYGPVIDHKVIPAHPYALFEAGHFDKSRSIPALPKVEQEYLANRLYPPRFDGELGCIDQGSRQMALWGEVVIDCNFLGINKVKKGKSYAYPLSATPGLHTQDLNYTFNDPQGPASKLVAQGILQAALTSFVVNGIPEDGRSIYKFRCWRVKQIIVSIREDSAKIV